MQSYMPYVIWDFNQRGVTTSKWNFTGKFLVGLLIYLLISLANYNYGPTIYQYHCNYSYELPDILGLVG